jgi:ankyrin repeat protein
MDALMLAISKGSIESIQGLLERGADLNKVRVVKDAPMGMAIQGTQGVSVTIDQSGDRAMRCGIQVTPLAFAAQLGNLKIVRLLLERGANPNPPGESPLLMTLVSDNQEVAGLLLEAGTRMDVLLATMMAMVSGNWYILSPGMVEAADKHGGSFDAILPMAKSIALMKSSK